MNNIRVPEENGFRFIAVTQGLDTDQQNPASRFLLHVLGAAAEFERALIRERNYAGQLRYRQDEAGRVGKAYTAARAGTSRCTGPNGSSTGRRWPPGVRP
jgi:DNA invertase Pin-like site-specific DNA recombinase